MKRCFHQVDVFSSEPLMGNPLAVVHDAQGLSDDDMAALARWTNLSETTFLLPPTDPAADYRVRIFTPGGELPFAGHPTLGSAWAWLAEGGQPREEGRVVQECAIGRVRIRRSVPPVGRASGSSSNPTETLAFAAPPLRRTGPLEEAVVAQVATAIGVQRDEIVHHQWVDNGPGWCAVMLRSGEAVRAVRLDAARLGSLKLGLVGPQAPGEDTQFEVRAFVPGLGVYEDPVTGSLNAGLAQWLIGEGLAPESYVAAQGHALRRAGRVQVQRVGEDIWIGGTVTPVIRGEIGV